MPVYDRAQSKNVLKNIKKDEVAPVYLLWGERYLYQSAYEELISALLPEKYRNTNLQVMDADNEDFYRLAEGLKTFPFFPGRQVFVVRDTCLFHSRGTPNTLLAKSHDYFVKGNLRSAAKALMEVMTLSGLAMEDVRNGGWGNIAEGTWEKVFGAPRSYEDVSWLNEVTDFAIQAGLEEPALVSGGEHVLEETLARGIPPSNHLVLLTDAVDKRKSLYRLIEKIGVAINFEVDRGTGKVAKLGQEKILKDLIKDILSRHGKAIEPAAAINLIERIGFNLASLAAALEKLTNYIGERQIVTVKDIDPVVRREKEEPLYELASALSKKDVRTALLSLDRLFEQGYAPLQILASLIKQIRRLLLARWALDKRLESLRQTSFQYAGFQRMLPGLKKDRKIPKELEKLSPYPLFLLLKEAKGFEIDHLISCMSELHKADVALKSSGMVPRILLEDLILKCLVFKPDNTNQLAIS